MLSHSSKIPFTVKNTHIMCNHDNTHVQQCTFRDALNLMSKKSNWFEWQSSDYTCNVHCICVYSLMTKLLSQNVDMWKFRSDKLVHVHTCTYMHMEIFVTCTCIITISLTCTTIFSSCSFLPLVRFLSAFLSHGFDTLVRCLQYQMAQL